LTIDPTVSIEREYLQAVLSWLDARLEREVRSWQLAGQDHADRFRGLYISDKEALAITRRGPGSHWSTGIILPVEIQSQLDAAQHQAANRIESLEKQAEDQHEVLRLLELQHTFDLTEFEWWALIICLAPALDLRYERLYAYLQDDVTRTHASVDLILNLLLPEGLSRLDYMQYFDRHANLRRFRLLEPVEEPGKPANNLRRSFTLPSAVFPGSWAPTPQSKWNSCCLLRKRWKRRLKF
jgi:hypothetical protein